MNRYLLSGLMLNCVLFLSSCTSETCYRGVNSAHWQELTAEQKQLIVDQAYEAEFNSQGTIK